MRIRANKMTIKLCLRTVWRRRGNHLRETWRGGVQEQSNGHTYEKRIITLWTKIQFWYLLLEFPLPVVQRADLPGLQPPWNTVEVESMLQRTTIFIIWGDNNMSDGTYVANSPGNSALVTRSRSLVRLALNAQVHDVVSADGAVVHDNV
jgi:hypothetical protein